MSKAGEDVSSFCGAVQDAPGAAEFEVGEPEVAVAIHGSFPRHVPELLPPRFKREPPSDCLVEVVNVREVECDLSQGPAGMQARLPCQLAGDVELDMEDAALDYCLGPGVGERGADPGPAVGDHHGRRRNLGEQRFPGGARFARAPLPGDHLSRAGLCDQQAPGADPDTIDEDYVVDFTGGWQARFECPAPRGVAAERAACSSRDLGLGLFATDPDQKPSQLFPFGHVRPASNGRRPASSAPPPLCSRGVPAVLHQW